MINVLMHSDVELRPSFDVPFFFFFFRLICGHRWLRLIYSTAVTFWVNDHKKRVDLQTKYQDIPEIDMKGNFQEFL